ncbi:MAG: Hpt domain-containing protein [Nitrospiraceae bacterium]|nr:Hpt domain-containing protein [Nitrospiraceae bacterium]
MKKESIIVTIEPDLKELLPGYLENRRKDTARIWRALDEKNYEEIRIIGHNMKGSGGGYGLDAISKFGQRLESAAAIQEPANIIKTLAEISDFLERLIVL